MRHKESAIPKLRIFPAAICTALMLIFCGQIFAQAGIDTGSITGSVKDPIGALVIGANCTLTNTATPMIPAIAPRSCLRKPSKRLPNP